MKHTDSELPSNCKFGILFTFILAIAGIYCLLNGIKQLSYIFFFLATLFLFTTFIKPALLSSLNKLWMGMGTLLGMIVHPIILGIIFWCIFTPIAFLMRVAGRDELRLRLKERKTYWKGKETNEAIVEPFKNQF